MRRVGEPVALLNGGFVSKFVDIAFYIDAAAAAAALHALGGHLKEGGCGRSLWAKSSQSRLHERAKAKGYN